MLFRSPSLTARENVAVVTEIADDPMSPEDALALVGLTERLDHFPAQLSGGEQQRVAIARALINQPSILLADEPTGNLDAENEGIVMRLLNELHEEGHTIIMVTHDPAVARAADRRIDLAHGHIEQIHEQRAGGQFSLEQERAFDEVLERLWTLQELGEPATMEEIHSTCGANPRSLPLMRDIGLLGPEGALVTMTERGSARAASVIRRHRLAERLFLDTFQMEDEAQLESNACTFEHILSPEVTERICIFLNHPDRCPHGSPIPRGEIGRAHV